ncbi:MAG: DedA family protein [Verrucomicrobia bacterium]|nr:MAG: DedA family protein [Verrucomicrobiota bacterium]
MRLLFWMIGFNVLLLLGWFLFADQLEKQFSLQGAIAFLENSGSWAWLAGIGLLASDLFLPIPATVIISALGIVYGTVLGGLIGGLGLMVAGMIGYTLGRCATERFARRWLGDHDFEKGRLFFAKNGGWAVAISRALPTLPEVISCTAGIVRMSLPKFMIALACGSLPMGLVFAAIGEKAEKSPMLAIALSIVIPCLLFLIADRLQKWRGS